MAPLRRFNEDDQAADETGADNTLAEAPVASAPRWIVISGLVLYCSVFWAILYVAGAWLLSLFN